MPVDWVTDVDAHEMAPTHLWGDIFGESSGRIGDLLGDALKVGAKNDFYSPDVAGDVTEIDPWSVWNVRGVRAPGAFDFSRRPEVLDTMQVSRQLVFPSFALIAMQLMQEYSGFLNSLQAASGDFHASREELKQLGRSGLEEYNEWAVATTSSAPDRLRAVAYLPSFPSVASELDYLSDLVGRGVRAVHVPAGVPIGGQSPGSPELDDFWGFLASHDVTCTLHLGGDGDFLKSTQWSKAPAFKPGHVENSEIGLDPYSFGAMHLSFSNFLVCLIFGGVFERHPSLRFGVIETAAHWFGPLIESLDMWYEQVYADRLAPFISMLPSEYAARNVRVTPLCNIEPIEMFVERYPQLQDCYCYSSDYPHVEGGKDSKQRFLDRLAPLGDDVCQKFFVDNGRWLLPD